MWLASYLCSWTVLLGRGICYDSSLKSREAVPGRGATRGRLPGGGGRALQKLYRIAVEMKPVRMCCVEECETRAATTPKHRMESLLQTRLLYTCGVCRIPGTAARPRTLPCCARCGLAVRDSTDRHTTPHARRREIARSADPTRVFFVRVMQTKITPVRFPHAHP